MEVLSVVLLLGDAMEVPRSRSINPEGLPSGLIEVLRSEVRLWAPRGAVALSSGGVSCAIVVLLAISKDERAMDGRATEVLLAPKMDATDDRLNSVEVRGGGVATVCGLFASSWNRPPLAISSEYEPRSTISPMAAVCA